MHPKRYHYPDQQRLKPVTANLVKRQATVPFTFGISHVPWLARLVAVPSIGALFRRPRYSKDGSLKGLSAAGAVCEPQNWHVRIERIKLILQRHHPVDQGSAP